MRRLLTMTVIITLLLSTPVYAKVNQEKLKKYQAKQDAADGRTAGDELNIEKKATPNQDAVKVTDTADELHVYSNEYANRKRDYGAIYSTDELNVGGVKTEANDGYGKGGFDELHINENYLDQVWQPEEPVQRLSIDEFRLPNEL